MNKQTKGIVTVLAVAAVVAGAFVFFNRGKAQVAKYISKMVNATYVVLLTFEEGFLRAWAKALKKGDEAFDYNGKTYVTLTGKAKQ